MTRKLTITDRMAMPFLKALTQRHPVLALAVTLCTFLLPAQAHAQCGGPWTSVGSQVSAGEAYVPSVTVDGSGMPYVAYSDASFGGRLTVRKFDGSWQTIGGSGFTNEEIYSPTIRIYGSTPYVAYADAEYSAKITVKKFNGTSWENVGSPGFSPGFSDYTRMAIAPDGTLYVACSDYGNSQKATVMKFNGTSWVLVGTAGFSAGIPQYIGLAIDPSGIPYISYADASLGDKAVVMKYVGGSWVGVGTAGFTAGGTSYTSLAIGSDGIPYVAFIDNASGYKGTVRKFDGTNWIVMGSAGFTPAIGKLFMTQGTNGTIYVSYPDGEVSNKATVKYFNGSSWATLGTEGFTLGRVYDGAIAIGANNTLYYANQDGDNAYTLRVNKYAQTLCPITGTGTVCVGSTTTLSNATAGGVWSSGSTVVATVGSTGIVTGQSIGNAEISYVASSQTVTTTVTVNGTSVSLGGGTTIYSGQSAALTATGSTSFSWSPSGSLSGSTGGSVTASPTSTTVYTVTGTTGSCTASATVTVNVVPVPTISALSILTGNAGSTMTLTGTNFNTTLSNNTVLFGTTRATPSAGSATSLTVSVPSGAAFGPVAVTNLSSNLSGYSLNSFLPKYDNSSYANDKVNFNTAVQLPTKKYCIQPILADFDGDGRSDIALTSSGSDTLSIYRNISSGGTITAGSFDAPIQITTGSGTHPFGVSACDVDGDGKTDLVYSNNGNSTFKVLLNTTSGSTISFTAAYTSGTLSGGGRHMTTGDIDGDGKPDVFIAMNATKVAVVRNTSTVGSASYSSSPALITLPTVDGTLDVKIADLNGDGKRDIVGAMYANNAIVILGNSNTAGSIATASFQPSVNIAAAGAAALQIADMDGDGKPDIIIGGSGGVSILRNTGATGTITSSTFETIKTFSTTATVMSMSIADVNGDGKPDVVGITPTNAFVMLNTATSGSITSSSLAPYVTFATPSATSNYMTAAGDLDGDGKPDLVTINAVATYGNSLYILQNNALKPVTGTASTCVGGTTTLSTLSTGGTWSTANSSTATVSGGVVTGQAAGTVNISYCGTAGSSFAGNCIVTNVTVNAAPSAISASASSSTIYQGQYATLTASGATSYTWSPAATLSASTGASVIATPIATTAYNVVSGTGTCTTSATVTVTVTPVTTCAGWSTLGAEGFSTETALIPALAIASDGTKYVGFRDSENGGKATVMKYSGGAWSIVGNAGFSAGAILSSSICVDGTGIPYYAYKDNGTSNKATVMKFNGSAWVPVGIAGFSPGAVDVVSIARDASNGLYVAFKDNNVSSKVSVMKFDGTTWNYLGSSGFSAGAASYITIALSSSNIPYVSFVDAGMSGKVSVSRYVGGLWERVGSAGFSAGGATNVALAIDGTNAPYVAYQDNANSNKATVMKFNGSNWATLGSAGFTTNGVVATSIAVDGSNTPYVAFGDSASSGKMTVVKYNGSSWATVGAAGFSSGASNSIFPWTSIAIDGSNNPWLAYSDASVSAKVVVKGYSSAACPITGTNTVCLGSTTTLSNATAGGTWASGDPGIATVDASGVVTGQAAGTATIIYTALGQSATTIVTVGNVYSITATAGSNGTISPSGATAACGGATQVYTITPASGYHVADVLVDGSSVGAPTSYTFSSIAASHTVSVTFASDCTAPTNTSGPSVTNVLCYGSSTGAVTPHVSGTTPLTWSWSNDASSSTLTGLAPGIYTYTVSNDCGSVTGTATVTQPSSALSASSNTVTNVLCYGGSTGVVSVTATGGTSPYTGTGNMTGKAAGTHSFTVTDANGCTASTSSTVGQPSAALSAMRAASPVLCYGGSTGSATITATGGTAPYSGTGTFGGLTAGTYTFTVTDANGCTANAQPFVGQPSAALSASNSVTNVSCYGASTGSVNISATGGTTPYTGTGSFTGKAAGSYSYTVTDANGCTSSTTATITQPEGGLVASKTITNVNCYGENNGSVLVSATGGTAPYTGTGNMTGLTAGTYTFTVTDGQDCSSSVVATVTQPTQLVASKNVTNVSCYGMNNGQVIVSASGGTSPYSGTGTNAGLSPEGYSYTVTDANGCTSSVSGTITEPSLLVASNTPVVSESGFNLLCNKGGTGIVNVSATGGTAPYYNTGAHGGLTATGYEFYVTDSHGCIDSTSGTLDQPDPFYISTTTSDDTICNGSSVSLSATGSSSYYTWYANNGIGNTNSASPVTATPSTGTPTVTVGYRAIGYNGFGCPSEPDTVDVTVLPIGYFSGSSAVCTDFSVDLDNTTPGGVWYTSDTSYITVDQNGLVGGVHYIIGAAYPSSGTITYTMPNGCYRTRTLTVNRTPDSIMGIATVCPNSGLSLPAGIPGGGTWASSNSNMSIVMSGNGVATVYGGSTLGNSTISYILPTGCYVYKTFTVAPLAPITGPTQVCTGNTMQLSHPLPGAQWSSSAPSFATVNISTGLVSGLSASPATITYKVNPTCYVTYPITVNTTPAAITGSSSVCKTFNTTLGDATTGGTWVSSNTSAATVGSTTGVVNGANAGATNISYVMPSGCYSIKVVTVNDNPASITGANNVCVSRTSTFSIATTGGSWSSSSSVLTVGAGTGVASGVAAGNANISYTLGTGCYSMRPVTVAALPAAITGTTTMCESGSTTLTSTTPSLTWSSTDENVATVATATTTTGTVSGLLAGTSTISYTSVAGCTQTVNVTVYAAPGVIGGNTNVCVGATTTYTNSVTGGTWSSSATGVATVGSGTGVVSGIGAGSCTITYTAPGGCRAYKTVSIDALPAAIAGSLSTCVGGNTTLTSTPIGQTWSSASTTVSVGAATGLITGLATGTALISYTNAAGCARTTTVTVASGLAAITAPASICVGGTTTLTCTSTGGTWASSNGAVGSIVSASGLITGVSAGNTNVTYRTSPTCFTTTSVSVLSAPAAITGPSASVCQNATLQLSHTLTGGAWSSGTTAKATVDASGLVTGVTAGSSTISYIPAAGCLVTYLVSVNAIPNGITGTAIVCDGSTTTLATTSTGGSWVSSNTDDATVSTSGVVTGIDAGTSTISYKFTATGCFVTKEVTVNALPDAIIGDNSICAGLVDTFTNNTPGGAWASATTATATIGTATGILSAVAGGTTTISYTLPTGCRTTKVFTVYALPSATITGTATVCEGATTTLTCTATGHTWSSTNTAKATIATASPTTATVTGAAAGTTTISYTTAQGCARTFVVSVNTAPTIIAGNFALCAGKVDTLTDATTGGTWNSATTGTATIGSSTGYITAVAAGTTLVSYTLPNGCRKTNVVTVSALPASISGSLTLCGNSVTTLTCTTTGGAWSSNNTDVATAVTTNSTTGTVTGGLTPGTAIISYTSTLGCSRTTVVTVSAALPVVTGPDAICVGAQATFASGTGGTWSSSNTAKGTIVSTSGVATGVAAGTTTLSYKVSAQCYAVKDITVNAAVAAITGTTNVCAGNSTMLSCTTPGGTWSSLNSGTASILDNSVGVVTGAAAGSTLITYQVTATGCFKTTSVNVLASPAAIEGTLTLMTGTSTTLTNSVSGGTWSSSASTVANIGSTTGIMNGVSVGNAIISYKLSNGCAKTAMATIVSSLSRPVKGITTEDATVTSVRIFPNPSQGNITVEAPASGTFMVFSMDGKQVARFDVTVPATSVTLPYDLAAGMYMCRFEGIDGSSAIVRLVYKP